MKIIEKYYHKYNGGFTFTLDMFEEDIFELTLSSAFFGYVETIMTCSDLTLEDIFSLAIFLMKSGVYNRSELIKKNTVIYNWKPSDIEKTPYQFAFWVDHNCSPHLILETSSSKNYCGIKLAAWDKAADLATKIFDTLQYMETSWNFELAIPEEYLLKVNRELSSLLTHENPEIREEIRRIQQLYSSEKIPNK